MLDLILHFHARALAVVKRGAIIRSIQEMPIMNSLMRMKNSIPNDELNALDDLCTQLDQQMDQLELLYK
jgi:hypothetical protein